MYLPKKYPVPLPILIGLALVVMTAAVFWQVTAHDFINCDDDVYVTDNPHVKKGISLENVIWAFTTIHAAFWHPLTWLSHMLDVNLYGMNSQGHHFTNIALHVINTLLLFLVLKKMTGRIWQSSFVAALFAVHPLHVESVAWVAQRKDVLSTAFWLLTMWAYARYVERPVFKNYLGVVVLFILGLMSKPMLVTLPFVFLTLDYWPLNRFTRLPLSKLIFEKTPLFVLSAIFSAIAILAQSQWGSLSSLDSFPLSVRTANTIVSYARYIVQMIWPMDMVIFYPHPAHDLPAWEVFSSGVLLLFISFLVIRRAKSSPYLAAGWFWYLVTLLPVSGIVQVGIHGMADRYTYVPLIGLFIMIAWGLSDTMAAWRWQKVGIPILAGVVIFSLGICSWFQTRHWRSSRSLFEHVLRRIPDNWLAHNNLGQALYAQGKTEDALFHYKEALRLNPKSSIVHYNLGNVAEQMEKTDNAFFQYSAALQINPNMGRAHINLGNILVKRGKIDEAAAHYLRAIQINPDLETAHNNLANALAAQGRMAEALRHYTEALRLYPDYADAHRNMGNILLNLGRTEEAIRHYAEALRLEQGDRKD